MLRSEDVSKNMLLRSDDTIFRVIDVRNDNVFLIDCIKRTMPEWADLSTVLCLEPCTEEDLWTETDVVIPEMQALTPEQLRLVHERFTMIAVVLPFVSDKKERIRMIDRISQEKQVSKQTVRYYLCLYLAFQNVAALAPKSHIVDQMMQGQVSTWTEAQVEEKLSELCIEYRAVSILNGALNLKRKSIKALSDDISNAFRNMKIPGTVIEKLDYTWVPALKAMQQIATTQWSKIELSDREAYVQPLSDDAQKVWSSITSPKAILQRYMEQHGHNCTDEELDGIYAALKAVSYNSPSSDLPDFGRI